MASVFDNTAVLPMPQAQQPFAVDLNNSAGLNVTILPSVAMVGNALTNTVSTLLTLTANAVNNVCFSVVTGAVSVVVGVPGAGLVILYVMTTNANAVTNVIDYRLTFNPYNANALVFTV